MTDEEIASLWAQVHNPMSPAQQPERLPASAAYADRPAALGRQLDPVLPNAQESALMAVLPPFVGQAGRAAWYLAPHAVKTGLGLAGIGGAAALAGTGGPNEGIGADFVWNDPNKERAGEISKLEQAISSLNPRLDRLIEQQSSARGKATVAAIEGQTNSLRAQVEDAQKRLNLLKGQATDEREVARQAFTKEAADRRWKETSLFDVIPGTRPALPIISAIASHGVGHYIGRRMPWYAGIPTAGLVGGGLGAYSVAEPNSADMSLPATAPARKAAINDVQSGDYFTRLLSSAGGSAGSAMLGAIFPALSRRAVMPGQVATPRPAPPGPSPQAQGTPPMAGPPQVPAMQQPMPQAIPLQSPPILSRTGTEGLIWNPRTGNWVRPDSPAWMLP